MNRSLWIRTALSAAVLATGLAPVAAFADDYDDHRRDWALDVEIWTEDDRDDGYYHAGESVHAYVRPTRDAYVVVYGADVHGVMHLLYPFDEYAPRRLNAGDIIELDGPFFEVGDADGIVYLEALVSEYPIEPRLPSYFYEPRVVSATYRWDYAGVRVSPHGVIIGDPHLALADFRRTLVPVGCAPYARAHATFSFRVGTRRHYPRYVCADCHLGSWYDPYGDSCSVFEIRIDALWADTRYWNRCEPRYYYRKRPVVPYRYRSYKTTWSGRDGCDLLTRTFSAKSSRETRYLEHKGRGDLVSARPGKTVDKPVRDRSVRGKVTRPNAVKPKVRDGDSRATVKKPSKKSVRDRTDLPRVTKRDRPGERPAKKAKPKIERQRKRADRSDDAKRPEVREPRKRKEADRGKREEVRAKKRDSSKDRNSERRVEKRSSGKKDKKSRPEAKREKKERKEGDRRSR